MSIFDEIRERKKQADEQRRMFLEKIKQDKSTKEEKKKRIEELKLHAKEYYTLFQDKRYEHFNAFIDALQTLLTDNLKKITVQCKNIEEQALVSARISAQLELLETIKNHPINIIKFVESQPPRPNGRDL